jgi:Tol biopolymer transport system component/DNA-binding winged helix-turn-helix (wHTH) protein
LSLQTRQIYRFGRYSLDATTKVVLRDGEPVRLARKAVETLLVLVEHPGQVLTKEELIAEIWQGRVVDEANLMQNIAVVRRALSLQPGQPGYIETFPGRGYRMLGPIVADAEEVHGPQIVAAAPLVTAPITEIASSALPRPDKKNLTWIGAAGIAAAVATALVVIFLRGRWNDTEVGFRRTAVARLGGKEFQPAISPDGLHIAFVLQRDDGLPNRIWVRPGTAPPFTISKAGWEYASPAWSPDGKQLAFLRFGESGELVVTDAAPNAPERVLAHVYKTRFGLAQHHIDWSPDGNYLAVDDTPVAEQPFGIDLISVKNGERRRLTTAPANSLGDVEPRFSPDGKTLSFIRVFHRARQGLFTIGVNGGNLRQMTNGVYQISGQDWAADGKNLIIGSNRTGDFRLWRISLRPPLQPVTDWTGTYGDAPIQLALARRAATLIYSVLQEDFNIWRLDLTATGNDPRRWSRIVNSSAQDVSPQYSPNGQEICFRSDRTGDEQLWVAAADGTNARQITTGNIRPSVGRWSPDGNAIVFNDSREIEVYIARRETDGNWKTSAVRARGLHPVFSSDGKWIYAGLQDRILKIDVSSGATEPIAAGHGLSFGLSLDGRVLYFVRELTNSTLWQLDLENGNMTKLLTGLVPYCSSCWAAGHNGVYYLGAKPASVNGQAIYFHPNNGGADTMIAEYPEPLLPLGSGPFSLSSDGRYLLCVRVDPSNADVMQIEPYH